MSRDLCLRFLWDITSYLNSWVHLLWNEDEKRYDFSFCDEHGAPRAPSLRQVNLWQWGLYALTSLFTFPCRGWTTWGKNNCALQEMKCPHCMWVGLGQRIRRQVLIWFEPFLKKWSLDDRKRRQKWAGNLAPIRAPKGGEKPGTSPPSKGATQFWPQLNT